MRIITLPRNASGNVCMLIERCEGYIGSTDVPHVDTVVYHEGTACNMITMAKKEIFIQDSGYVFVELTCVRAAT